MAPHGRLKRDKYPWRSTYFELLQKVAVEEIRELSERLCVLHRRFPVRDGLSHFPDVHATGGNTSLRRY